MSENLAAKTITELAPLIESKEVSPVDVALSILDRVKKYDGEINSHIYIGTEEEVVAAAKAAEAEIATGDYKGPLHGIPLALKDIFSVKDEKTTIGSKIHKDLIADTDAAVVEKLKEAGAFFTGKLNLHEYATGGTNLNEHYGPCRNPWDTTKIPGGSSGGSGAAVAADLTIASLGTDTGGSIRIPSSANGIIGLKPTHGLVSKFGCFPLSWSLDHIGPMTKTVSDAAIMMQAIAGYDKRDATSIKVADVDYLAALVGDVKGKVIGIEEDYFFNEVDAGVAELVRAGIATLEELGAKIEIVKAPALKYAEYAEYMTFLGEAAMIHKRNMLERPEDFGPSVRDTLLIGSLVTADMYLEAQQIRKMMANDFAKIWEKVDVVIAPSTPILPYTIGDQTVLINGKEHRANHSLIRFNAPANLLGIPSLSIPCGFSQDLPVGMQIMGPALSETTLINIAYAFEQTNPLGGKKPELDFVLAK
ncbi:MAG: amidase [Solibacillus sp.]